MSVTGPQCLYDLGGLVVADTYIARLALTHDVVHGTKCLLHRRFRIEVVEEIDVDMVQLQTFEAAIDLARSLSDELDNPARFVTSNIYDLPEALDEPRQFDAVYTSYGVLVWLPDLPRWARVIAHFLKPGRTFYIIDDHPVRNIFGPENDGGLSVRHPYFRYGEPLGFKPDGQWHRRQIDLNQIARSGVDLTKIKTLFSVGWEGGVNNGQYFKLDDLYLE